MRHSMAEQVQRAESKSSRFDVQAEAFEEFAGFEPSIARRIAGGILELARLGPEDRLLELGAATGLIGRFLVEAGIDYLGIDLSRPMLEVFRRRAAFPPGTPWLLIRADGDRLWPVADHSVGAVFGSRVVHLLDPGHTVREVVRVGRAGAVFLIGRVVRDPEGLKSRLRRQKRALWAEAGRTSPEGGEAIEKLLAQFTRRGARLIEPTPVASWDVTVSAEQILSAWETKAARGASRWGTGRVADFEPLRRWAQGELGALDRPETSTESFVIQGVSEIGP